MSLNLDYVKMQHIEAIKIEHSFCDSNNDESKKNGDATKILVIYYQIPQHKQIWYIESK